MRKTRWMQLVSMPWSHPPPHRLTPSWVDAELVQYCVFVQLQYENQLWVSALKEVDQRTKCVTFEQDITL